MTRLELRHQLLVHARQYTRFRHLDDRLWRHASFNHVLVLVRKDLVVDDFVEVAGANAFDNCTRGFEFLCVQGATGV